LLALSAQDIVVSDLEGSPVLITSDGSSPLEEGAAVPASGRLSLGEDSKVTLREGSRKVELFRRGLYEIGELFTFRPLGKVEFEQIFEARIKSVNLALKRGGPESTETIIATSVLETAEREPEQLIEGVRHLVSGRYAEARSSFNTFLESPPEEEGGAVHLAQVLAAQSAFFLDENAEAYETLSRIRPSSGDSHYPLYLLLRAQLLIESHAFADALETLAEYLAEPSGSEADLQTARLLTGVAYEGLGNLPVARTYYRRATSPDPTSDAAKAARRLLE
jgi:tetratricopeptide (TPR) repeat protein